MRFDAYAGNVRDLPLEEVAESLAQRLGTTIALGRGMRRYSDVLRLEHGGHCAVWVGRDTANELIYFEGKGDSTPELVDAVRTLFPAPAHNCSRVDVCEDYDAEGAFEALQRLVRGAKGSRVKAGYVALPDEPTEGRTWASGVRGGDSYLRLYEAGKMAERAHLGRPHWCRLELEKRPHYSHDKVGAAVMDPLSVWGMSAWTRRVAEVVTQADVPVYEQAQRVYTPERTKAYLARGFRRFWEGQLAEGRDWTCLGREFEDIWRADDEVAARLKGR